jgi:hypothetical protein
MANGMSRQEEGNFADEFEESIVQKSDIKAFVR